MSMDVMPCGPTRRDTSLYIGGVPLGGLGTGTVELRADGSFREWQIFNNWGNALSNDVFKYAPPFDLLNAVLALRAGDVSRVLETTPALGLPGVEAIDYNGKFPFADLSYRMPQGCPLSCRLRAFSAFVPFDAMSSGVPAFALDFTFENSGGQTEKASLALSFVNPFGTRSRALDEPGGPQSLECGDGRSGIALRSMDAAVIPVTYGGDDQASLRRFWSDFSRGKTAFDTLESQGTRLAAVVPFEVAPGAVRTLRFVFAWFFPDHHENGIGPLVGHRYEEWFGSALEAAGWFSEKHDELLERTIRWRDTLLDASWPTWVTDWLVNIQANLVKSSWWVRDGRFGIYESFECPDLGAVHIIDLADWPVLDLFRVLELDLLKRIASDQKASGEIQEQYCVAGAEAQAKGFHLIPSITYPGGRDLVDLAPKYAIEVYHRFKETGDDSFLAATYPAVRRAMTYAARFDRHGVGLPSGAPIKTTWDHWDNGHIPSYAGSMWVGGLLAAGALAEIAGDAPFAESARQAAEQGRRAMDDLLWTGEYYAFFRDESGAQNPLVFVEQIYGELFSEFVGLGGFLPEDRVRSSLRAVARCNHSTHGLVCLAAPDGTMVRYQDDPRCEITVCHMLPAAIAMVSHGDVELGLEILKRVYDLLTAVHKGGLWNAPHHVLSATGARNPRDFSHYLRDQSLWVLLKVLSGWDYNAVDRRVRVGSPIDGDTCRGPWIVPTAYGVVEERRLSRMREVHVEVRDGSLLIERVWLSRPAGGDSRAAMAVDGMPLDCSATETEAETRLSLRVPLSLKRGQRLTVQLETTNDGTGTTRSTR